jgi:hypothetical protein
MGDKTIVRLKIISTNRTPEEIDELVGIRSHKSWHIGDRRPTTIIQETNNGWVLNSEVSKSATLEAHIAQILDRVIPYAGRIHFLSEQDIVELSCVIYASASPALNFSNTVIQQISSLGASLDIDLYILPEEDE